MKRKIGFVGCPPEETLRKFFSDDLIDLDATFSGVARKSFEILPSTTCSIVKRIVDNALSLELDLIIFDDGYGKCDEARAAADVITSLINTKIVRTRNSNTAAKGTPVCDSDMNPLDKAEMIVSSLTRPLSDLKIKQESNPPAALWGVPASDFAIYRLFPKGTKLLGWFRCLENRTPADHDLERFVDPGLPTVFLSQSFCHKNILARHLALKYNGLHVDIEGNITNSIKAKIEAFLEFRALR